MPVPNQALPNTRIESQKYNENNDSITDGSAMDNVTNPIIFANTQGVQVKDSGGTARDIVNMDTDNVIQLGQIRRQGGDATDFNVFGTSNFTETALTIQAGCVEMASGLNSVTVTFPTAFKAAPLVWAVADHNGSGTGASKISINTASSTTVDIISDINGSFRVNWFALGPMD